MRPQGKVDKAYTHIRGLYANYPDWEATFNPCPTESCEGSARGTGICADCHEKALAKYVGVEMAENFHHCLKAKAALWETMRRIIKGN